LSISAELLERHPFPGPGLAIRCLCTKSEGAPERIDEGWILPVKSVGVQGDARTYRYVLSVDGFSPERPAGDLVNRIPGINRVVAALWEELPIPEFRLRPATLTAERLDRLRRADAIVRRISLETGVDALIWQSRHSDPVRNGRQAGFGGLAARAIGGRMTANAYWMRPEASSALVQALRAMGDIAGVYYDLTPQAAWNDRVGIG